MECTRELFGILGSIPASSDELRYWNAFFEQEGRDAAMNRYPTTPETLPERLSEMFHFDRRGYIVGDALQIPILPLLDVVDQHALEVQRVDTVVNRNGVLFGLFIDGNREKRWNAWIEGVQVLH